MASYQYIYTMKGLSKNYPGGKQVLKDIYLSFLPGAKIGILGANGSGKSSLLKIMAGEDTSFIGEAFSAKGINIGYLAQEPQLDESKTVGENVLDGVAEIKGLVDEFNELSMKFSEPLSDDEMNALLIEQGELQEQIDAKDGWELDRMAEIAMDALRCPDADSSVVNLSGGERRRVALCRLLLSKPDMLLLDEPTNHLDPESIAWLEQFLEKYAGTVVAVTHDRYFLDNVAGWILELDRGEGYPFEGNYSAWLENKEKRLAQEEKSEKNRQRAMAQELEWVRQSPKARQAKSKARLRSYDEMLKQETEERQVTRQIVIPAGPRLGDVVIKSEGISKSFGDKLLYENLDFNLPRGGIVGIIGANGAGKTTLFKMITGEEKPDSGGFTVGETVKVSYVSQSRDDLNSGNSVWQEISGENDILTLGKREIQSRAYVSWFNFKGSDQQKKIGSLSGGERNRVQLAKTLLQHGNVLLMDEPTNDLDVETLRALEEALLSFPGCAVVISHDRWFLDRIATHILAFEGDSQVIWFEGNYQDYVADKIRRLGVDAAQPHKIRYKPVHR